MTHDRRRVLLVEPYHDGSHRAWAEGYAARSRHDVTLVTHAGGFWKWRMQGAALTLAERVADVVAAAGPPDVVLASDMVHLPALLGLARRALGDPAVALYLHENQLTYPLPEGARPDLTYGLTNWLSMAAADLVLFATGFHRGELLGALPGLLRSFPDHRHGHLVDAVAARCEVLPVGVDLARFDAVPARRRTPPTVVWNQRWEYDKDPAAWTAAVGAVADGGVPFRVALAGDRAGPADDLEAACRRLGDRVVHVGRADAATYAALLRGADVVVSTARHEFFGVAVVEAAAAGCLPLLPRRLSYPELLPAAFHDACLYDGHDDLVARLRRALLDPAATRATADALAPTFRRFDWSVLAPAYDDRLDALADAHRARRRR